MGLGIRVRVGVGVRAGVRFGVRAAQLAAAAQLRHVGSRDRPRAQPVAVLALDRDVA